MSVSVEKYNHTAKLVALGAMVGPLKVMLVSSAYTMDPTHELLSSISAHEISGTGYTAGGADITGEVLSGSATGFVADADDIVWPSLTATFRRAIIYYSGTLDAKLNPPLLSYLLNNPPADIAVVGTDYTLVVNTAGLVTGTYL